MYKNILIPIAMDNDARAADAIEVATAVSAEGATITLLHVMEHLPAYATTYLPQDHLAKTRAEIAAKLTALAGERANMSAEVIEGHSGKTILAYAADKGKDLIVVASHLPGMQDLLIGSTAAQVVRHAQCSVLVMR